MNVVNPYLDFVQAQSTGKTQVWYVRSKRSGGLLGVIRWYGAWRQYTFWPEPQTIFNAGCMVAINTAIERLMAERRISALKEIEQEMRTHAL